MVDEQELKRIRRVVEKRLNARSEFMIHGVSFIGVNIVAWLAWSQGNITFGWDTPWPLLIMLPWLSGILMHSIEITGKAICRPDKVEANYRSEMDLLYGPDWRNEVDSQTARRIHKGVRKRIDSRAEFLQHAAAFIPINLWLWVLWESGLTFGLSFPWVVLVMILWGIGLVIHGLDTVLKTDEKRIQREIQREMERLSSTSIKAKRHLELEDDDDDNLDDEYWWDTEQDDEARS